MMVANFGPASYNYEETATTLRYANRAKNIKNKPRVNEDPKDALLREFQQEIARLKAQINEKGGEKSKKKRVKKKKKVPKEKKETREENENEDEPKSVEDSGESVYEDEYEEDGEAEGADDEEISLKETAERLATEKELLENDTSMLAEEKNKILEEMRRKEAMLSRERAEKEKLAAKIAAMESKLLTGDGKTIVDHTNEQQRALEQRRAEVAARLIFIHINKNIFFTFFRVIYKRYNLYET